MTATRPLSVANGNENDILSRRNAMGGIASILFSGSVIAVASPSSKANALDMDAFINAELASDAKNCDPKKDPKCVPKLSEEEALCKYGQGGKAKSEACRKVRSEGKELPSVAPQGKSLGGAYAM